ncbi:hypothetical protein HZA86_02510 [Candidatus Uhrbacteria bacterium]|nr:hypothetical protein [Candidatus Uhrbacteria bacterium]
MPQLSKQPFYRAMEMVPGLLVWATFIASAVLSFVRPVWVVLFIIILSILWLLRVLYFVIYLLVTWRQYQSNALIDWSARRKQYPDQSDNIVHAVVLPAYTEPIAVLQKTLQSFTNGDYPSRNIIVVLAGEARDASFPAIAQQLVAQFHAAFRDIFYTIHPAGLPGEIAAKGANAHWAGQKLLEYCRTHQIATDDVIVSYFDSDTCVSGNYFSMLTAQFIEHPNRYRTAFQPIAVYTNNIWESPLFTRVSAFSTTFWLMTELARPERLYTFSSHAMSLTALVDVGFWQSDIVTDDSRIFLQCFLHYDGDFTVTPLYATVSMNTAMSSTWWKSMINLYLQQRRWAYGVEHFPYLMWHFRSNHRIARATQWKFIWKLIEGTYTWATTPILLFIFGNLPLVIMRHGQQSANIIEINAPIVLQWLMGIAMIGIVLSAIIGTRLLPKRPSGMRPKKSIEMILQWAALPVMLIAFGAIPATEAQTRLMIGRYLGFRVTKKLGSPAYDVYVEHRHA